MSPEFFYYIEHAITNAEKAISYIKLYEKTFEIKDDHRLNMAKEYCDATIDDIRAANEIILKAKVTGE